MNTMSSLAGWIEIHPVLFACVIWPFVLGLFTLLFKPRTPEEYAAIAHFSPRLAGFLQMMGALGIDPVKAATIFVQKVLLGGSKPPNGPSVLAPIFVLVSFGVFMSACTPGARWSAAELLERKIACAIAHQDLPPDQILAECAVDPKDAKNVLDIVGESRRAAAKLNAKACAPPPDAGAGDAGAK